MFVAPTIILSIIKLTELSTYLRSCTLAVKMVGEERKRIINSLIYLFEAHQEFEFHHVIYLYSIIAVNFITVSFGHRDDNDERGLNPTALQSVCVCQLI